MADDIGTVSYTSDDLGSSMVHTDSCSISTDSHDRYYEQSLPCRRFLDFQLSLNILGSRYYFSAVYNVNEHQMIILRKNHCELYTGYGSMTDECSGMRVVCQSIDVNPDNSALLLRTERFDDEVRFIILYQSVLVL